MISDPSIPVSEARRAPRVFRRIGLGLLLFAQLGAALALGGVFAEAIGTAAALLLVGLALAAFRGRTVTIDGLGLLLLGLTAATALQLLPLPIGVVQALSPVTADVAVSAAAALGEGAPTRVPLSLDPAATGVMLVWMVALTAAYLLARRLAQREPDQRRMVLAIPIFGLVVVVVGLVHAVLGLDAIYGLYTPSAGALPGRTGALFLTSFVSPNHLAAFLNLGIPIALTAATTDLLVQRHRILFGLVAVVLLAGVVLTGSRAGVICAVLSYVLVLVSRGDAPGRALPLLGLALVAFLAVASPLAEQLASLPGLSELAEATDGGLRTLTFDVIRHWPWVGVGRGAFGIASTQLNDTVTGFTVTYAHNTPLQVIADLGVPIGLTALLAAVLLLVRPLLKSFKAPLLRGVGIGIGAVFLHNLVDFNLDILGVALPVVALLAVLRAAVAGTRVGSLGVVATALVLAATTPILMGRVGPEPGPRRDAMIATDTVAAAGILRGDAYAFFQAGVGAKDPALLAHAARLAPFEPRIPLAQASFAMGDERLTLLRAALSGPESWRLRPKAFALLLQVARTKEHLRAALPDAGTAAAFLASVKPSRPAVSAAVLRAFPEEAAVLEAVAAERFAAKDWIGLEDVGTRLMAQEVPSGYRWVAEAYRAQQRDFEAYSLFLSAGDAESSLKAAEIALAGGDPARALWVVQGAKVSPKYLKRLKAVEDRARVAMAAGTPLDLRARFDAEHLPSKAP